MGPTVILPVKSPRIEAQQRCQETGVRGAAFSQAHSCDGESPEFVHAHIVDHRTNDYDLIKPLSGKAHHETCARVSEGIPMSGIPLTNCQLTSYIRLPAAAVREKWD